MDLTVATATFNVKSAGRIEALKRCVRSVALLKVPHEHLIFDGGSNDGTKEILSALAKEVPTLKVVSERDSGIYNALNKAVKAAQGLWFNVLGCDDYITHPDALDELLEGTGNDVDVIVAQSEVAGVADRFYFDRIHISTPYCHQGVFARTSVVRRFGGFDETYRVSADFDMMLKWHEAGCRIKYVNEPVAYFAKGGFCQQSGGALGNENAKITSAHFALTKKESRRLDRYGVIPMRVIRQHLNHQDEALRQGARYMYRRYWFSYLMAIFYPLILFRRKLLSRRG